MSGIFKGDSIYKSGGGGGGFKDGGQLVDGDFIDVENNTVSQYENTSRNEINFYIEAKDGEILNSLIEMTTQVNATVYVYVVKNGLYYLLGNVGGDTVNAGESYNVNISGNSYLIEQVTEPPVDPEYINFGGQFGICRLVYTDTRVWTGKDLMFDNYANCLAAISNLPGWRIPSHYDWDNLRSYYGSDACCVGFGWNGTQGTNTSKFSAEAKGYKNANGVQYELGVNFWAHVGMAGTAIQRDYRYFHPGDSNFYSATTGIGRKCSLRLCKNK
jgi:hypothetical protein